MNNKQFNKMNDQYLIYVYSCHYIEGVIKQILHRANLIIRDNIKDIKYLRFNLDKSKYNKNALGNNLELYQIFFGKDEICELLEKHLRQRNKYLHRFFEIVSRTRIVDGKNTEVFDNLIQDLNQSVKLAEDCLGKLEKLENNLNNKKVENSLMNYSRGPFSEFKNIANKIIY